MNQSEDAFPVYIDQRLLRDVENVLHEGESVADFALDALRKAVKHRAQDAKFIERGLVSREEAKRTGVYFTSDEVLGKLDDVLNSSKSD
jgi:hypothetical protein